jgi:hypothetical protein
MASSASPSSQPILSAAWVTSICLPEDVISIALYLILLMSIVAFHLLTWQH